MQLFLLGQYDDDFLLEEASFVGEIMLWRKHETARTALRFFEREIVKIPS